MDAYLLILPSPFKTFRAPRDALAHGGLNGLLGARTMENRTSRITVLIDPDKKKLLEEICASKDLTPSQVIRQLIRQYIVENAGNRVLPEWLQSSVNSSEP
jgi:hypothetical protein